MQFIFSKNMDLKLSNDVPTMFKAFLDRILSVFEIWWKSGKSGFLAIFEKIDAASKNHKLRSGRRKNILRPFFERLWSTFSISNFIFIFSCLFVTWTAYFGLDAIFGPRNHLYRFGYKKASKNWILLMQLWWDESSRRELSKSGFGMFLRPLVMILCLIEVLGKGVKKEGGVFKKKNVTIP